MNNVPAHEVLLEAAEYLCKLGSNLRLRSESFKDKRINKDKLRHATEVKKAADKLLLICNLSKKSIDNVEVGVHKVLSVCESQIAMQIKEALEHSREKKAYTFEYKNCRLRISKKICLDDYVSAKVLVSKMSDEMLSKYPVYFNCKSVENNRIIIKRSEKRDESDSLSFNIKERKILNKPQRNIKIEEDKSNVEEPSPSDSGKGKSLELSSKQRRKSRILSSSDSDGDNKKTESCCKSEILKERKKGEDNADNDAVASKSKDSVNDDISSQSENQIVVKKEKLSELGESLNKGESNSGKNTPEDVEEKGSQTTCKEQSKVTDQLHENDNPLTEEDPNNRSSTESLSRPKTLLKCVDINKLLSSDLVNNEERQTNDKSQNAKEKRKNVDAKYSSKVSKDSDRHGKNLEVENFKPKKFDIVVERMPDDFACLKIKYKLDNITYKGLNIANINNMKESNQPKISNSVETNDLANENNDNLPIHQQTINKIKSLLLQDDDDPTTSETNDLARKKSIDSKEATGVSSSNELANKIFENENQSESNETNLEKEPPVKVGGKSKSDLKQLKRSLLAKKRLMKYSTSDSEEDIDITKPKFKKSSKCDTEHASTSDRDSVSFEKTSPPKDINDSSSLGAVSSLKPNEECLSSQEQCIEKDEENSMGRPKEKSGDNSESHDTDQDIEGLTNIKNLGKTRRRETSNSTAAASSQSSAPNTRRKAKTSNMEQILPPESDDDSKAGSAKSDEVDETAEVQVSNLNGNNLLGNPEKYDLLGESEASSDPESKDKTNSQESKGEESADEENVKSKRRKQNTISSDSDTGTSRKKDQDVKMSDFEDSDDDGNARKKSKRKKKDESDADSGSDSASNKKKRRRIKQVDDSDVSGSESETEGRKHGRKNIRKVMGKNQLEEATKKAARQEKERIARIAERQKLYNNMQFDESGKPDEVVLDKVVLDFDPETKEPLIEVDKGLVKKLKPHQANGIKFMWDACFESVKRIKKDKGSGCILAHCMGLGKTLQVVSLTHTLLTHGDLTGVRRVLVVCPLSTVLNWVNEFNMWLKHTENDYDVDVYEISRYKQNVERAMQLRMWFDGGGVCVLGYEMFRNLSADNSKKYRKKMLKAFQEALVDPGPDLVVCDEGHLLKNEKTSLSQSMNRVTTLRRIVLTGTPLQNNLKEYYCMVQFVKPNLLGKYNEYLNRFVNPITNGQYTDSTETDIKIMKRRSHVLHKMLDGAVQRRDYGVLAPFLPPKHEYVLFITLTDIQTTLYQYYLDNYSRRPLPGKSSGFLFPDFQSLQRIWTHPLVLKYNSERYEIMQQKKREREEEDSEGSLVDFIDDESTPDETSSDDSIEELSDASDDSRKKTKKNKSSKKKKSSGRRTTRANPVEPLVEALEVEEVKNENPTEWWIKLVSEDVLDDLRNSHKLVLLFDILRQCEAIGDKLLVFSQSLYSLDLIEHFLGKVDEATQEGRIDEKLGGHVGSWSPGVDYFRLDGSTSCENRSIWCKNFNREDNPRARLFLISTRAGGLGINLVAANRVVIFDVSWNPSHDVQSIFRVYRFGQKKPCYVYRFLAMGTMEEKIYERQVTKQAISKRVIDEQQIDRHYAENDLAELYKFEPMPPEPRPLPPLPKDRLFAEMLKEHEKQIYKYHEHDSLLENKEEETLTEEERKAAWEDFENEKTRPPPTPFPTAGLMAQQQQQLAYAALATVLRKDIPNISDTQIRDLLPLVYNSNPALMQKITDIYKYMQPGMMAQGMMNPVLNAAASGGMGGSSGLQYEPPWQRQQQQQQQMRLQQLMQQQNQMGAKYYAGGLGSRDPVAMALQQRFAREIGSGGGGGGGAGRPRGRPPLQPRAPPAATAHSPGDVVNLDSD